MNLLRSSSDPSGFYTDSNQQWDIDDFDFALSEGFPVPTFDVLEDDLDDQYTAAVTAQYGLHADGQCYIDATVVSDTYSPDQSSSTTSAIRADSVPAKHAAPPRASALHPLLPKTDIIRNGGFAWDLTQQCD